MVRSKSVLFSATTINEFYGFPDNDDGSESFIENIKRDQLDDIFYYLDVVGTSCRISKYGHHYCVHTTLKLKARIWYNIMRNRIMPTSYDQSIDKDGLILLYVTLERKYVNIGCILHYAIKTDEKLFFPL